MAQGQKLWGRRWFKITAVLLSLLTVLAGLSAWHARIWTWRGWDDLQIYQDVWQGYHPILDDLRVGRIRSGDDVEQVVARIKPLAIQPVGEGHYTFLYYEVDEGGHANVRIVARGRKVVYACYSACPQKCFFNDLSGVEERELLWWFAWLPKESKAAARARQSQAESDLLQHLIGLERDHGILVDLRESRIRSGDEVEGLIARTKPDGLCRQKQYVILFYGLSEADELHIVAKDGKVIYASLSSRAGEKCFFNSGLSADELKRCVPAKFLIDQ